MVVVKLVLMGTKSACRSYCHCFFIYFILITRGPVQVIRAQVWSQGRSLGQPAGKSGGTCLSFEALSKGKLVVLLLNQHHA